MSDELDPSLLRRFAQANEPLPGAEFQAQLRAELQRSRGWPDIAHELGFFARAILAGVVAGVLAPFKVHYATSNLRLRSSIHM
jgi:hypothetical protein